MKLLIAADMEGITGVARREHVDSGHPEYQRFRHLMTADVNAAIAGAAAAGADDIQVADGHGGGTNLLIEELDPRARLNCGSPSPFSMVEGVQDGIQAALFVGYHARAGSRDAVLDHTWSSVQVANVWLNGRVTGETGLNAAVCGAFGAPVLLVTGDQTLAAEALEWLPGVETAVVKTASGRTAAQCLPPAQTQVLIRDAARRAVQRFRDGQGPKPLVLPGPVQLRVEFLSSRMGDGARLLPGAERLDGRTLEWRAPDMPAAYQLFRAAVNLAEG